MFGVPQAVLMAVRSSRDMQSSVIYTLFDVTEALRLTAEVRTIARRAG
jgi:hypothetical protein